jgi:hypothetical protein
MALQVEQGSLVVESALSSGGLRTEQASLLFETSVGGGGLRANQVALLIEIGVGNLLVELTGGGYCDFLGHPLAFGYLMMSLNTPSEVYTSGSEVIEGADTKFKIQLDSSGNVVAGQHVFSNQLLTPACQYVVTAYAADGTNASASPQTVTVPSASLTYNISNWPASNPAF